MSRQENNLYEFGSYRLDANKRVLWRQNEVVPLTPKAIDLLVALIENSGEVLSKDQLMKMVWPDTVVEEANLSHHVFTLRKALGEEKNGAKYIETIPRRGYRFVAPVIETDDAGDNLILEERIRSHIVIEEQSTDIEGAEPVAQLHRLEQFETAAESRARPKLNLRIVIVCLAVIGVATAVYFSKVFNRPNEGTGREVRSVAVLPLKVVSGDEVGSEYLADGISEALITRLTRLPNLRVIPWVTAARYRELAGSLPAVADEMQVDALITGSIRRSGDRISLTVSLIDGQTGLQYWADEFEEPIADILTAQRRIAIGAARELKGKLSREQEQTLAQSPTRSAEAYEYYLRGKAALRQGERTSEELNQRALDLFRKALTIDPNLAEAHSGIGHGEYNRVVAGWADDMEKAEASFQKALELNPTLAEAFIGLIRVSYSAGRVENGLKYARSAASLGMDDADMLTVRGRAYYYAGLWDKAVAMYERVIEIDPANEESASMIIPSYLFTGEYGKAVEAGEKFSRKFPNAGRAHYYMGLAYRCLGIFERAKEHFEKAIKAAPEDALAYAMLGYLLKQTGQLAQARRAWLQGLEILRQKVNRSPENSGLHGALAEFYGQLGDKSALVREENWILAKSPDDGHMLAHLADAFARLGETEHAVDYYRRAMQAGFLTFSPVALAKVDGTENVQQSAEYTAFISELKQITNRLREEY